MSDFSNHRALAPLGHPTTFKQDLNGPYANDLLQRHATNGVKLQLPTSFLDGATMKSEYVLGPMHSDFYDDGVQNTNGRAVWHVAQNVADFKLGDTAPDLPVFAEIPPNINTVATSSMCMFRMAGITEFNRLMKHNAQYRVKYGDSLTCAQLKKDWPYFGVQQSKQTALTSFGSRVEENNIIIKGRARVPCIWHSQEGARNIRPGDSMYLMYKRFRYNGNMATDSELWKAAPESTISSRKRMRESSSDLDLEARKKDAFATSDTICEEKLAASLWPLETSSRIEDTLSAKSADAFAFKRESPLVVYPAGSSGEYYWNIVTYVSIDRKEPDVSMYMGDVQGDPQNQYVGDFNHVGSIIHNSKGDGRRTLTQLRAARKAIYTSERNAEYFGPLRFIDEIELQLGHGHA